MCHTADDAARIVKYTKYPPVGSRGYGPAFAVHSLLGVQGQDYDSGADKGLLVSVQIESRSGVENVEEIAKVDGLDVLLIGKFMHSARACVWGPLVEHTYSMLQMY